MKKLIFAIAMSLGSFAQAQSLDFDHGGPGGGGRGPGGIYGRNPEQIVECSSNGYAYNTCTLEGDILSFRLVRQLSKSACIQGLSFGADRNYIWVDKGCRAQFAVSIEDNYGPIPSTGSPLSVTANVEVGCKGRVVAMIITNLSLVNDYGSYLTFRGYKSQDHKCGDLKHIAATVEVSIQRRNARVDRNGILLAPAVNARVSCQGQSDWIGRSNCQVVNY